MVMMNKLVSLKLSRRNMVMMNKEMVLKVDYRRNFKRHKRDFDKKQSNFRRQRRDLKRLRRNFAKISNDLKFNILSCLPTKSLVKFRCVSKEFHCLIDDPLFALEHSRRLAAKRIPFTGFFTGYQPSFISTNNTDAGCGLPDSSLSFLKEDRRRIEYVKLIDSCNGLLLCKVITRTLIPDIWLLKHRLTTTFFVCNPLTMQKVLVPHPRIQRLENLALISKSTAMGYLRYKVVCIYDIPKKPGGKQYSKLCIFSSETGEWEKFHYRLPAVASESVIAKRTKIFVKGTTLFWDCFASGKYILVCYFNNKVSSSSSSSRCFELIKSPCEYENVRCLWNYNGEVLFYFNKHFYDSNKQENGKLSVWSLCFGDNDKIEWKNENSLQLKTLAEDFWKYRYRQDYHGCERLPEIQIIGYNPNFKTMYVLMGSTILSYDLLERRFELVLNSIHGRSYASVICQYIHSLEPIEIGRKETYISTIVDDDTKYNDDDAPILFDDDDDDESDDDADDDDDETESDDEVVYNDDDDLM